MELLDGHENVANCSLVCQDGIILSHKLVIASISKFLKNILSDIPVGDDVSIYFPDFKMSHIRDQIRVSLDNEGEFDINIFLRSRERLKDEGNGFFKIEIKSEDVDEPLAEEILYNSGEDEYLLGVGQEEVSKIQKKYPVENITLTDVKKTIKFSKISKTKKGNLSCKMYKDENLLRIAQQRVTEIQIKLEDSSIPEKKRMILEKQLKASLATCDLRSGRINSVRAAAKKYNLAHATLFDFFKGKTECQGTGGGRGLVFDEEEADEIKKKILEKSNGGLELTRAILKEVLTEELKLKKLLNPDLKNPHLRMNSDNEEVVDRWYAIRFAKTYGLMKYIVRTEEMKPRPYECDLCSSTFTLKNSLVSHQQRIHLL